MGWLTTLAGSNGSPGLGLCLHLDTRCVHMMSPVYRVAANVIIIPDPT